MTKQYADLFSTQLNQLENSLHSHSDRYYDFDHRIRIIKQSIKAEAQQVCWHWIQLNNRIEIHSKRRPTMWIRSRMQEWTIFLS